MPTDPMIAMSTPQNATNRGAQAMSVGSPPKPVMPRPTAPAPQITSTASGSSPSYSTPSSKLTTAAKPSTTPISAAQQKAGVVASSATSRTPDGRNSAGTSQITATTAIANSSSRSSTTDPQLKAGVTAASTKATPSSGAAASVSVPSSASQRSAVPTSSATNATASASISGQPIGSLLGIHDLEAVAQAAMGLDANGNPLPGNEESHRSLAEAVKRLSAMQNSGFARATGNYVQQQQSSSQQQEGQQYQLYAQQMEYNSDGSPMKRFQCHLCDRAFARAYNLNTHLATHDPDPNRSKPFPCPYASCKADGGRSFSRKHDLQRHVASTHENEPPPEDEEIDENGERISTLIKLGLGTPGRKFRCDECGRAFVRRDALKRHQCMPLMTGTPPPPQAQQPRSSANGSGASTSASASTSVRGAKAGDAAASAASSRSATPNYSTSIPAGLSLYTSTAPTHTKTTPPTSSSANKIAQLSSSSSNTSSSVEASAPPPFYPTGITYESLTREVQDMAMQLVAQATTYNQAHTQADRAVSTAPKGNGSMKPMASSQPSTSLSPALSPSLSARPVVGNDDDAGSSNVVDSLTSSKLLPRGG